MSVRCLRLLFVVLLPMLCSCQSLFFGIVNTGRGSGAAITQTYSPAHDLKLDIYRPAEAAAPLPVALFFYGGSWRDGSRGDYAFVGQALARQGILAMVVDYRLYPQGRFPDFEVDAAAAVKWAMTRAPDFDGDPRRVFVVGHSAGAQIVALLATDGRYLAAEGLKPRDLAGAVGIAGPYDFLPLTDPKLVEVFGPESQWPASQPINFVNGDEPPFLLLHGQGDKIVWPRNSEALEAKLRAAGEPVTYLRYPSLGHFRILSGFRFPALAPTLRDTAAFIKAAAPSAAMDLDHAARPASGN